MQSCAQMLYTPPDISLPTVTPPQRPENRQPSMTTLDTGTPTRTPSSLRPALSVTQSSLVSNRLPTTCTSVQASTSQPSPWLLVLCTVTLRTVTFVDSTRWTVHIAGLMMVTPSTRTLVHR